MGADYPPGFQQIAFVDTETGNSRSGAWSSSEEAEKFYRDFYTSGVSVRVGMEASGHARWFERQPVRVRRTRLPCRRLRREGIPLTRPT
jgi:transposase